MLVQKVPRRVLSLCFRYATLHEFITPMYNNEFGLHKVIQLKSWSLHVKPLLPTHLKSKSVNSLKQRCHKRENSRDKSHRKRDFNFSVCASLILCLFVIFKAFKFFQSLKIFVSKLVIISQPCSHPVL